MKSKNPNTIPLAAKVLWNYYWMISSSAMISTSGYMNSISAFQKKEIKSYKKKKSKQTTHQKTPLLHPNKQKKNLFFYTKLRQLEHFSENDQNSLADVQYANKPNYSLWLEPKCLTPVRGSFSPGILAGAALFQECPCTPTSQEMGWAPFSTTVCSAPNLPAAAFALLSLCGHHSLCWAIVAPYFWNKVLLSCSESWV